MAIEWLFPTRLIVLSIDSPPLVLSSPTVVLCSSWVRGQNGGIATRPEDSSYPNQVHFSSLCNYPVHLSILFLVPPFIPNPPLPTFLGRHGNDVPILVATLNSIKDCYPPGCASGAFASFFFFHFDRIVHSSYWPEGEGPKGPVGKMYGKESTIKRTKTGRLGHALLIQSNISDDETSASA